MAAELAPFGAAARRWLRQHKYDAPVAAAVAELDWLLAGAGQPASAYDLRSMSPSEKATTALSRAAAAGVRGTRLLEITLTVGTCAFACGPHDQEFQDVQLAKAVHRLASGTHKTTSGRFIPAKYAPSTGGVLRKMGRRIWKAATIALTLDAIEEVAKMASPASKSASILVAARRQAVELVAQEIMRARKMGMGHQMLAKYRRQLRAQHGLR